jgi:hypothetical protein
MGGRRQCGPRRLRGMRTGFEPLRRVNEMGRGQPRGHPGSIAQTPEPFNRSWTTPSGSDCACGYEPRPPNEGSRLVSTKAREGECIVDKDCICVVCHRKVDRSKCKNLVSESETELRIGTGWQPTVPGHAKDEDIPRKQRQSMGFYQSIRNIVSAHEGELKLVSPFRYELTVFALTKRSNILRGILQGSL